MLKKAGLLSTCCTFSNSICVSAQSSTSPYPAFHRRPRKSVQRQDRRTYAQTHSENGRRTHDDMNWPILQHQIQNPTPYEIFDLDKGAAYSKHRFYELVKIYHPDRHGAKDNICCGNLTHTVRMERYRLVIQAHEILSDPARRREYDCSGEGWVERHHGSSRHTTGHCSPKSGKPYGRGKDYDESPFANATWEDWEQWYAQQNNTGPIKQEYAGNYFNPNLFASLVLMMAIVSGIAQANRATQHSSHIEDRAHAFTEKTTRFLNDRAEQQKAENPCSDRRVKWFLEKRDPSKVGLKDEEGDIYKGQFVAPRLSAASDSDVSDTAD